MLKGKPGTTLTDALHSHFLPSAEIRQPGERTSVTVALNPVFVEALMGFMPGWTGLGFEP